MNLTLVTILASFGLLGVGAQQSASNQAATGATGGQVVHAPATNAVPSHPKPAVVYITDFRLNPSQIEESQKLIGGRGGGGLLNGQSGGILGGRSPLHNNDDPEAKARKLVRTLSDSIIKQLKSKGIHAELLPSTAADYMPDQADGRLQFLPGCPPLPQDGWLVTGWFEKVVEGNAALTATVGMGKGAGNATADVAVSDLTHDPAQPFLIIGSGSRAKKAPGGLATMNPYVMAAKFVINKREGMEKEVKSLGKEIAKSLVKYIDQASPQSK